MATHHRVNTIIPPFSNSLVSVRPMKGFLALHLASFVASRTIEIQGRRCVWSARRRGLTTLLRSTDATLECGVVKNTLVIQKLGGPGAPAWPLLSVRLPGCVRSASIGWAVRLAVKPSDLPLPLAARCDGWKDRCPDSHRSHSIWKLTFLSLLLQR